MMDLRTENIPAEQAEVAYRTCRPILQRILSNAAFADRGTDFWRTLAVSIYTQGMLDAMTLVEMGRLTPNPSGEIADAIPPAI